MKFQILNYITFKIYFPNEIKKFFLIPFDFIILNFISKQVF